MAAPSAAKLKTGSNIHPAFARKGREEGLKLQDYAKGIKHLVDEGLTAVPPIYVRPPQERPVGPDIDSSLQIPIIDLAGLQGSKAQRHQIVKNIGDACRTWGFFQVINHGVPQESMTRLLDWSNEFFNLSTEDKLVYYDQELFKPFRYGTSFLPSKEETWEWHDYFQHPITPAPKDEQWPEKPPHYKEIANGFASHAVDLGRELLKVLAEYLGLDSNTFVHAMGDLNYVAYRLSYYPPCPNPDLVMGLSNHSDPGGLTILLQDLVGGLQIRHQNKWVPLVPHPGALTVSVADQLEILTNGVYKSVDHRVTVNAKHTRITVDALLQPPVDFRVRPLPEFVDEKHPPKYKECLFGSYFHEVLQVPMQSNLGSVKLA